ncbi:MAG TPA: GNAT family N-acetyltransferase, partial [Anaerolineae bacterium]|nr:GNAT family N-acetyltransferase [Anaerolineae bacterium]
MRIESVTLEGHYVRLEPLTLAHYDDLVQVGLDEDIWRWTLYVVRTPDDMRAFIEAELQRQATGANLVFAQIDTATGRAVGTTRL